MTSPVSVGSISVEVVGELKGLAKKIREEISAGLRDLDLSKQIRDAIGSKPVDVPLDVDTSDIPAKIRQTRVPKVPVELDPVVEAFQRQVRRETAALARTVNVNVPVEGDTDGLRARLGRELAAIQAQSKMRVPVEPGDRAAYQAKLRAQLAQVAAQVKQTVKVDVDVDRDAVRRLNSSSSGGLFKGLLSGISSVLPGMGRVSSGLSDITGAFQKLTGTSAQAGGAMVGAIQSATGPVGIIVGVLVAAAAAATLFTTGIAIAVPVLGVVAAGLTAVAGAAAAIPGALAGAAASFGALSLGFQGVMEAFEPVRGGGGGGGGQDPAARARQIAAAERGVVAARRGITAATRGVASAQRGLESANRSYRQALDAVAEAETRAARAQRAVSEARAEAKEDIDDLNRALRSAKLDEEAATLAVTDALRELNAVRLTGNIPDIQRADIAYRQAQLTLEDAKDTAEDYGKEQATANKRGVEGSDKVVAALEDQAQAQKAVKDAQDGVVDAQNGILAAQDALASANDSLKSSYDGLKSAQDSLASAQTKAQSASAGVAREVIKLAPAAQKFVDAVKALKPAFEDLRLDVQQKLFKDLDVTVTNLGKAWIPALKTTLGDYATTFNGFFQTLGANISTPTFIGQLQTAAEGARKGIEAVGEAISGPLVTAFGQLAEKSAPFLETIGDVLAGIVTDFAKWIDDSYKTGELQDFFETAASAVKSLGGTVRGTGRLIKNLFAIIFRGNGKNDKSAIDSFNDGLRRLNEWLEDPANQDSIATFLDGWKTQFEDFKKSFGSINELLGGGPEAQAKADELGTMIGRALISGILAGLKEQVSDQFKGEAWLMFFGPIGGLVYWIRKLMGINSPSTVMMEIGNFIIDGLVGGIKDKLEKVKETAKKIPGKIREGVGNALETLKTKGGQFVDGLKTGIGAKFTELKTKASELKTKASEGLAGASKTLYGRGREVVGGLMSGIGGRFKELRTFAGYAQDYIQYALRSAGNFLYDHGRAVIFGLIDGISSTLDTLGSFLGRIGSFIQNHKGPIEKDRTLLVGAGQAIMSGLIVGIGDRKKALAAELSDVTNLVGSTRLPALASDLGSVSANLSVQRSAQVQVAWAEGSTGDPLLDAIRRSVKFKWNGDPQAAFAS